MNQENVKRRMRDMMEVMVQGKEESKNKEEPIETIFAMAKPGPDGEWRYSKPLPIGGLPKIVAEVLIALTSKEVQPEAAFLLTEAWEATTHKDAPPSDLPVRERPDRKSILLVTCKTYLGEYYTLRKYVADDGAGAIDPTEHWAGFDDDEKKPNQIKDRFLDRVAFKPMVGRA